MSGRASHKAGTGRRWRREHGFIQVTGSVSGLHGDVFASKGLYVAEADAGPGRGLIRRGRYKTEAAAKRAVERWLASRSPQKNRRP